MALSIQSKEAPNYIVVIGTSAGGLNALTELVSQLDASIDASIFIVMHLSRMGIGDFLIHRLQKNTSLKCVIASNGMKIEKGMIYVAPPNRHLLVSKNEVIIGHGPQENRWRPSIDVLFRSAAAAHSGKVIGLVLTGLLDDGMAGMVAIKRCGGKTLVQDPNEAEYPDMPLAVLNNMEVDECTSLSQLGHSLNRLTQNENPGMVPIPEDVRLEAEIAKEAAIGMELVGAIGDESVFTCPDCGGILWKINNGGLEHFRCYIGHSYSLTDLNVKQDESIETTLWVAVRMLEERRKLLMSMEERASQRGFIRMAKEHHYKRQELDVHIDKLKEMLFALQRISSTGESASTA